MPRADALMTVSTVTTLWVHPTSSRNADSASRPHDTRIRLLFSGSYDTHCDRTQIQPLVDSSQRRSLPEQLLDNIEFISKALLDPFDPFDTLFMLPSSFSSQPFHHVYLEEDCSNKTGRLGSLDLLRSSKRHQQPDLEPYRSGCLSKAAFLTKPLLPQYTMPQNDADFDERTFNASKARLEMYKMDLLEFEQQTRTLGDITAYIQETVTTNKVSFI
ncbi:hypothetical protein MMC07_009596 [Pseudocyphellaria aurata]|nr:hypothetical protein [Pseudocyphellaria aurata]